MNCYLGVDIGSISTKGVIIDDNNNIICSLYLWTEGNPVNAVKKLVEQLKNKINEGNIKIPQFQREFVWKKEDAAKLLDSVVKGYPIGSFILWETKSRLRSVKNIGGIALPNNFSPGNCSASIIEVSQ